MNEEQAPVSAVTRLGGARSITAVALSALLGVALVAAYLAAGGASYEPAQVSDPCQPREWRSPDGIEEYAEQFTLSALDGAACELGVSREVLARAIASDDTIDAFKEHFKIDDDEFDDAVHAGLVRAVDDAEDAGAISPIVAVPIREVVKQIPVDQAISLIQDARPIFEDATGFLESADGFLGGLFDQAQGLIP